MDTRKNGQQGRADQLLGRKRLGIEVQDHYQQGLSPIWTERMRAKRNEANEQVEPTETNPEDQPEPAMMNTEDETETENVTGIRIGHGLIARGRSDVL